MEERAHFEHSTLREHIVEHVFVGDALRALWRRGVLDVEVLRSEFDAYGYDIVMARGPVVRHIQFKTGKTKKPGDVSLVVGSGAEGQRLRYMDSGFGRPRHGAILLFRRQAG